MERFAILLAGPVRPTKGLGAALAGRRVIAADGGMRHARPLQLRPELWVGDFDSADGCDLAAFASVPREEARREKDETDAELAAEAAIARGAGDLLFVGALRGPRSDHAFSNLVLALRYAEQGLAVELHDGVERGIPIGSRALTVDTRRGQTVSILRFGDVEGLDCTGTRWPLHDAALPFHSVLTQSNEALGPIVVRVRKGRAILLVQESEREGEGA